MNSAATGDSPALFLCAGPAIDGQMGGQVGISQVGIRSASQQSGKSPLIIKYFQPSFPFSQMQNLGRMDIGQVRTRQIHSLEVGMCLASEGSGKSPPVSM